MKLKFFRTKDIDHPIYVQKPYVLLNDEGVVLAAGTAAEIRAQSVTYDDCWVDIRRHDMHLNDNTKIKDVKPQPAGPKTILDLTSGCEIRVRGILGRITIETLTAFCKEGAGALSASVARDVEQKRKTQYAWTMQAASVLEADYPGKAEKLARQRAVTEAAPYVETGDILVVDGVPYVARVLGNYSDPVALDRFVMVHPKELAEALNVIRDAKTGGHFEMGLDVVIDELAAALNNKN